MATNEIYPFGTDGTVADGDVLELTAYAEDSDRTAGNQAGIARRALVNTVLRQVAHMGAGLAQFIANRYTAGVVDDGDLDKVEAGLEAAIAAMIADAADATEYALKEHIHAAADITDLLTTSRSYTAVQAYTPVVLTITDGAATWDLTAAPVAEITLTADVTLTVTNAVPGTSPILRITQDATGGWSVIWPSAWLWAGKVAHDVTTDAGAVDLVQVDVGSNGTVCARGDSDYGEVS